MATGLKAVIREPAEGVDAAVIWLHGLGADGHDFEPLIPELGLSGTRFIFPHAPVRPVTINGGMAMRAWYDFHSLDFSQGEDYPQIEASVTSTNQLIEMQLDQGIEMQRIVLAGFSQGGVIALLAGLRAPSRLAGIVALSTYLPSRLVPDESVCPDILQCHGDFDPVVPLKVGEETAQALNQLCPQHHTWRRYPMAHELCAQEIADLRSWLQAKLQG